jgi:hypothetical protein
MVPLSRLQWFAFIAGLPLCTYGLAALGSSVRALADRDAGFGRDLHAVLWMPALWVSSALVLALAIRLALDRKPWLPSRKRLADARFSRRMVRLVAFTAAVACAGYVVQCILLVRLGFASSVPALALLAPALLPAFVVSGLVFVAAASALRRSRRCDAVSTSAGAGAA